MQSRNSYHDIANELQGLSEDFRAIYFSDEGDKQTRLEEISNEAVNLLRGIALAVRSEQDYGLIDKQPVIVGALKQNIPSEELSKTINSYRPPYIGKVGFTPLPLREALNKIAHANPQKSGLQVTEAVHDMILSGSRGPDNWVSVISIIDLYKAIKNLPDVKLKSKI